MISLWESFFTLTAYQCYQKVIITQANTDIGLELTFRVHEKYNKLK